MMMMIKNTRYCRISLVLQSTFCIIMHTTIHFPFRIILYNTKYLILIDLVQLNTTRLNLSNRWNPICRIDGIQDRTRQQNAVRVQTPAIRETEGHVRELVRVEELTQLEADLRERAAQETERWLAAMAAKEREMMQAAAKEGNAGAPAAGAAPPSAPAEGAAEERAQVRRLHAEHEGGAGEVARAVCGEHPRRQRLVEATGDEVEAPADSVHVGRHGRHEHEERHAGR